MTLKVGDTVYFTLGELDMKRCPELIKGEIKMVGTKYLTVAHKNKLYKFNKSTLSEENKLNYKGKLYLNEGDYWNGIELVNNRSEIRRLLNDELRDLNLEQTQKILHVLKDKYC